MFDYYKAWDKFAKDEGEAVEETKLPEGYIPP